MIRYSSRAVISAYRCSLLLAVLACGVMAQPADAQSLSPGHTEETGSKLIEPPQPVRGFTLTHHSGEQTTDRRLQGRWDLLYFGYTFCPDVCPVALSTLTGVVQQLAKKGWNQDDWSVWLISVDPDRDTPARLGEYVNHFNTAFNGATGSRAVIDDLAEQMSVRYYIEPHDDDNPYYVVAHTSTFAVINPNGALVAVLDDTATASALADQIDELRSVHARAPGSE